MQGYLIDMAPVLASEKAVRLAWNIKPLKDKFLFVQEIGGGGPAPLHFGLIRALSHIENCRALALQGKNGSLALR